MYSTYAPIPAAARWLGFGGLLPFAGLVAMMALQPASAAHWGEALRAYGAVILSFVGALHWGFAVAGGRANASKRR